MKDLIERINAALAVMNELERDVKAFEDAERAAVEARGESWTYHEYGDEQLEEALYKFLSWQSYYYR